MTLLPFYWSPAISAYPLPAGVYLNQTTFMIVGGGGGPAEWLLHVNVRGVKILQESLFMKLIFFERVQSLWTLKWTIRPLTALSGGQFCWMIFTFLHYYDLWLALGGCTSLSVLFQHWSLVDTPTQPSFLWCDLILLKESWPVSSGQTSVYWVSGVLLSIYS